MKKFRQLSMLARMKRCGNRGLAKFNPAINSKIFSKAESRTGLQLVANRDSSFPAQFNRQFILDGASAGLNNS